MLSLFPEIQGLKSRVKELEEEKEKLKESLELTQAEVNQNTSPETENFKHFFESVNPKTLNNEEADSC